MPASARAVTAEASDPRADWIGALKRSREPAALRSELPSTRRLPAPIAAATARTRAAFTQPDIRSFVCMMTSSFSFRPDKKQAQDHVERGPGKTAQATRAE